MKQWILLSVIMGLLPCRLLAQDDLYFVPTKKAVQESRQDYYRQNQPPVYHSGSPRSVDEYNRRGSYYEAIPGDSAASDIIDFEGGVGVYPDSTSDYHYTRELARWDGYTPADTYWQGYSQGRQDSWATWHSPWYYSSYYPWYDSYWYDPWYYDWSWSWHYGYYSPWYYSWSYPYYRSYVWYGGHHPHYGGGYWGGRTSGRHAGRSRVVASGTRGSSPTGRFTGYSRTTSGARTTGRTTVGSTRDTSPVRSSSRTSVSTTSPSRTSVPSYTPSRSSSSGSFGGSRSSGGSFGGSRSSGSFGGSRSAGSGGSRGRR
jgi:hypothetical protein